MNSTPWTSDAPPTDSSPVSAVGGYGPASVARGGRCSRYVSILRPKNAGPAGPDRVRTRQVRSVGDFVTPDAYIRLCGYFFERVDYDMPSGSGSARFSRLSTYGESMASDHIARSWWRLRFEVEFRRSVGQGFEDLVQKILEHRFPDEYVAVKAAGSIGDKKCDGLLTAQRRLIACYGPEGWNRSKATGKIEADFGGALEHWDDDFDTWGFAHNDPAGAPPYVHEALKAITDSDDHAKTTEEWGFARLRELVFELNDEQLTDLLGPPVTLAHILGVEIHDIAPLLKAVEDATAAPLADVAPVPVDKLERNDFSDWAADLLRQGRRRSPSVGTYFEKLKSRPLFRDDLGARFSTKYVGLRDDGLTPDEILGALLEWIAGPSPHPKVHGAGLTVVAYFLDQCDIYEADHEEATQ